MAASKPKKKPMTASEMAERRWKGTTKKERSEAMRDAVNTRWDKAKPGRKKKR